MSVDPTDCAICGRVTYSYTPVKLASLDFEVCWQCLPLVGDDRVYYRPVGEEE